MLFVRDEILNGKTQDSNSHVFAQFCFQNGIDLCVGMVESVQHFILTGSRV